MISKTEITAKGEVFTTDQILNVSGYIMERVETATSVDGLLTTVVRGSKPAETTERSSTSDPSYVWKNNVTPTATEAGLVSEHKVDAYGVVTWTLTSTVLVSGNPVATVYTVRLDEAGLSRVYDIAERLYDTTLNRDLMPTDYEVLAKYIANGQLDKVALANALMTSSELLTKYGDNGNAEVISQAYQNAIGRTPSLVELNQHLTDIASGAATRNGIIIDVSESAEHILLGNGHAASNNTDLPVDQVVFDRTVDRELAEAIIERLVDTVYDRAPTKEEYAVLTDKLMHGTEQVDALAVILLAASSTVPTAGSTSLAGLTGTALVNQAFLNALGRAATVSEQTLWSGHFAAGRITTDQFIAALSESPDHLAIGNSHLSQALPTMTVLAGTSANNTLTGVGANNQISGLAGVDTITGAASYDLINGGTGNDTLNGKAGGDVYEWATGDGSDTLTDDGVALTETDTLKLTNVASTGAVLTRSGNNLLVTIGAEVITITNRLATTVDGKGIEAISFSDGVTWNLQDILAKTAMNGTSGNDLVAALTGSAYADNIFGLAGNDAMNGGAGNDRLIGGLGVDTMDGATGSDTYEWATGDGNDTIADTSTSLTETDTLKLTNVASTGAVLTRSGNNLLVTIGAEVITITNRLATTVDGKGIEAISFSDGVTWNLQDILAKTAMNGTSGNETLTGSAYADNIYGLAGTDTINAGAGDDKLVGGVGLDTLDGGLGNDTYEWVYYDGSDTITDTSASLTETDKLKLSNVASTGVTLERLANDLNIKVTGTLETIKITNQFLTTGVGIEVLAFSGGVSWTRNEIFNQTRTIVGSGTADTLDGTPYDDTISGLIDADILNGNGGNDTLVGGQGADTLSGGLGVDTAYYANSTAGVTVNLTIATAQTSTGDASGDILSGIENITGSVFADTLTGDGNNNLLEGKAGADTQIGGLGVDTASYATSAAGVTVNLTLSTAQTSTGDASGDILSGIENITGSAFADTLTGDGNANVIDGGAGNDVVDGGAGDDTLIGGIGADTLAGGLGTDSIVYAASAAGVTVNLTLATAQTSTGDASGDILSGIENITGSAFADTLTGDGNANMIDGGAGDDTLIGGIGADTLAGGLGTDSIGYAASTAGVTVNLTLATAQTSTGDASGDILSGIENITGSAFADTLTGDDNNNVLEGKAGADTLAGGLGTDSIGYAASTAGVTVNLTLATAQTSTGDASGDILSGIENITGSAFADTLTGDDNNNVLEGKAGADTLAGGLGVDMASYASSAAGVVVNLLTGSTGGGDASGDVLSSIENITGSALADTLTGDANANTLDGGAGNDVLVGGAGNDMLIGGAGFNSFTGGQGADTFIGGINDDTSYYSTSLAGVTVYLAISTAQASAGDASGDVLISVENLYGSNYSDILVGNDTRNTLSGGAGNDVLDGGSGDDWLVGGAGSDTLVGGLGIDILHYLDSTVGVTVDLAANAVSGGYASGDTISGFENVYGSNFNDTLTGDANANDLRGNSGNDIIKGGSGNDWIFGGAGNDTFRFDEILFGDDQIIDFEGGLDKLSFNLSVADSFSDFVITGNGTTSVTVALGTESIVVAGATAITLTSSDFLFS